MTYQKADDLPDNYAVQAGDERPARWYPLRFGAYRLDARGYRVSFSRREDAVAFCWNEHDRAVTAYPSVAH